MIAAATRQDDGRMPRAMAALSTRSPHADDAEASATAIGREGFVTDFRARFHDATMRRLGR